MRSPWLWWGGVVVLAVVVVAVGVTLQARHQRQQVIEYAEVNIGCQTPEFPCRVVLAAGRAVTLAIEPLPVVSLQPLQLQVNVDGVEATAVVAQLKGVGMNMGLKSVPLQQQGDGRYQATTILPICIRNQMGWEVEIMLETIEGTIVAPFRFTSYRL